MPPVPMDIKNNPRSATVLERQQNNTLLVSTDLIENVVYSLLSAETERVSQRRAGEYYTSQRVHDRQPYNGPKQVFQMSSLHVPTKHEDVAQQRYVSRDGPFDKTEVTRRAFKRYYE